MAERMREEEKSKEDENQRRLALEQKLLAESEEELRRLKLRQEQEKRNAENATQDGAFHHPGALISSVIVSSTIPLAPSPTENLPPPPSYFSVVSNNTPTVPDRNLKPPLQPSSFDANAQNE